MENKFLKLALLVVLLSSALQAQAGHLFTQALLNTPVDLTAGFGINIPQESMESTTGSSSSYINVCDFGSGDSLRVILPGWTQVIPFDSLPTGWSYSEVACLNTGQIQTTGPTNTIEPVLAALNLTPPFQWRIEAVSGSFTLLGYRLRTSTGTVNGTGSGTVNQTGVTASSGSSSAQIPILDLPHLVLLILGLIGVVGARRKFLGSQRQA